MPQSGEWSANFDSENVGPFLKRIAPLIESGFSDAEVQRATTFINATNHNDEREMKFPIKYKGNNFDLCIRVFMDDINAPDLYFFGPQELCKEIGGEMRTFAEELGL